MCIREKSSLMVTLLPDLDPNFGRNFVLEECTGVPVFPHVGGLGLDCGDGEVRHVQCGSVLHGETFVLQDIFARKKFRQCTSIMIDKLTSSGSQGYAAPTLIRAWRENQRG